MYYQLCLMAAYFACGYSWALLGPEVSNDRIGVALFTATLTMLPILFFSLSAPVRVGKNPSDLNGINVTSERGENTWWVVHAIVLLLANLLQLFLLLYLEIPFWRIFSKTFDLLSVSSAIWVLLMPIAIGGLVGLLVSRRRKK